MLVWPTCGCRCGWTTRTRWSCCVGRSAAAGCGGCGVRRLRQVPEIDDGWLRGPDGPHLAELVVPLLPASPPLAGSAAPMSAPATGVRLPQARAAGVADHLPGPGGWLQATVCVPVRSQDEVLTGVAAGLDGHATPWFFVRYRDEGRPSLRLRVRATPAGQASLLRDLGTRMELLREQRLLCAWRVDTYRPEVERFGGPGLVDAVEDLFCADTAAVLAGLVGGRDPVVAAAVAAVELVEALLPDPGERA